jgi:hypothetical protein
MPKHTIEIRQVWEINTEVGEEWLDVLVLSQQKWWSDSVEIDQVNLISSNTEVISVEGEVEE